MLAGPNQVIAFAMDGTGEYRLTTEPSKVADVWEGLPNPQPIMGLNKFFLAQQALARQTAEAMLNLSDPVIRAHGGPPSEGPLGLSMVLARLQQPPKEWDLRAEITTREFFGSLPFKARADFFKTSAADAQVLLSIALRSSSVTYESTPSGDRPAVKVYARVLDSTATELVRSLEGELDFEPSPANGKAGLDDDLVYQGRVDLPPGSYVARLTVLDEESSRTATSDTPFTVPDFGEPGLSLSTIALAAGLEQADPGDAPAVAPYRFGSIRVIPRLGQDYLPRESMSFYYQVYGAARDPATGKPKLDVTYAFLAVGAEELQEIGEVVFEGQETEAHGYTLPLQDWPAGRYLLRIEIDDRVAGSSATREVAFRVLEGP